MSEQKQFRGSGHWIDQPPEQFPGIESDAKRFFTDDFVAILSDENHLSLDCSFQGKKYSAQLSRDSGGIFRGGFAAHDGSRAWHGSVAGRLFYGVNGILFHGTWATDSGDSRRTFWADLQPVSEEDVQLRGNRFVDNGTELMTINSPSKV